MLRPTSPKLLLSLAAAALLASGCGGATQVAARPSPAAGSPSASAPAPMAMPAVAGDIPVGWSVGCMSMAHMEAGHAAGACTNAPVTPAQRAAAEKLVAVTTAAVTRKYPTMQAAEAAGYRVINATGPLIHLGNPAFQSDGHTLDPNRVESLVYVSYHKHSMLLGAMYIDDPVTAAPPLIGGALTSWHLHTNLCVDPRGLTALNPKADGRCAPGSAIGPTPQMLHVWTLPYKGGPFAEIDPAAIFTAVMGELQRRQAATSAS